MGVQLRGAVTAPGQHHKPAPAEPSELSEGAQGRDGVSANGLDV